jgi:TolB-like protein/DNA-binding winged helix-turn-helix (wHTH) protein
MNTDKSLLSTDLPIDLAREADFSLGKLRVRPSLREVECLGETADETTGEKADQKEVLEPRVMQVLVGLARRRGQVTSRDQLVQECWAGRVVGEDALQRCIAKVRRLAEVKGGFTIDTIARVGYRLTEVEVVPLAVEAAPATQTPDQASVQPTAQNANQAMAPLLHPTPQPRRYWVVAAALVVALLAIASYVGLPQWRATNQPTQPSAAVAPTSKLRLAMMPLDNFSPDPANAFFADGLHEEILSTLASQTAGIDVISRTTMMTYRGTAKSIPEIASELQITHVLEGSVRREGNSVRLTLQLIDASADKHVWSQSYDRTLEKALTLQADVASEVAEQLAVKLAGYKEQLALTTNAEAYDLYLQANLAWPSANSAAALKAVEDMLNRAIRLDPAFAKAYLHRARARLDGLHQSVDTSDATLQAIRADVATARSLVGDTNSTLMQEAAVAFVADQDLAKAMTLIGKTTALEPLDANQLTIKAQILIANGDLAAGFAAYQESTNLDPANPIPAWSWSSYLFAARKPVEAMRITNAFNEQTHQQVSRAQDVFAYTDAMERWHAEVEAQLAGMESAATLVEAFNLLRFEHRYTELADMLGRTSIATVPQVLMSHGLFLSSVGEKPLAELKGWTQLLLTNASADQLPALADGQALLDFLQRTPATRWNGWLRHLQAAEGALFTGDKAQAITEARLGIEMAAADPRPSHSLYAKIIAARIYAWAGEEEEAVDLLEQLSSGFFTIGPAFITRDPLYAIPLVNNERYKELSKRLEAEITVNRQLL